MIAGLWLLLSEDTHKNKNHVYIHVYTARESSAVCTCADCNVQTVYRECSADCIHASMHAAHNHTMCRHGHGKQRDG